MIGKKIRYFRLKRGLTSEELAKKIGVTKTIISLYETEEREPNEENLKKIANALDVSWVHLLFSNTDNLKFDHHDFRKKSSASKNHIDILIHDIETKCADRILLLNLLGYLDNKPFKFNQLSFDDDIEENAIKIRKALGIPLSGPIYNITNVLENNGIIVLSFDCAEEIDGLNGTVNKIPYLFFNSKNRTIERQRFTIIHETCHMFFNDTKTNKTEKEIEKYINKLAGIVLVPTNDIYRVFGRVNRALNFYVLKEYSKEYKVAISCLQTRLFEAGVVTEMYYKKYFMSLNAHGGKKNEKSLLDPQIDSEQPKIFTQQVYLALGEGLISSSKAAQVLGTSLYEVMTNMGAE